MGKEDLLLIVHFQATCKLLLSYLPMWHQTANTSLLEWFLPCLSLTRNNWSWCPQLFSFFTDMILAILIHINSIGKLQTNKKWHEKKFPRHFCHIVWVLSWKIPAHRSSSEISGLQPKELWTKYLHLWLHLFLVHIVLFGALSIFPSVPSESIMSFHYHCHTLQGSASEAPVSSSSKDSFYQCGIRNCCPGGSPSASLTVDCSNSEFVLLYLICGSMGKSSTASPQQKISLHGLSNHIFLIARGWVCGAVRSGCSHSSVFACPIGHVVPNILANENRSM